MNMNLLYCAFCFIALHVMVWFSANLQLVNEYWEAKSIYVTLSLAIPITLLAYYGTRYGYAALGESAWGVRFFAFALSYFIFPFFTYYFLGESMFTIKTMLCVILSFAILAIQLFM